MKATKVFPLNTFPAYRYVVTLSRVNGQWLFSRHRGRDTWETQGGHIEPGETPEQAARRELWEESGAEEYTLTPVCDYWSCDDRSSAVGVVFLAEITRLGPLPDFEMEELRTFDALPEQVTYPHITPLLVEAVEAFMASPGGFRLPETGKP